MTEEAFRCALGAYPPRGEILLVRVTDPGADLRYALEAASPLGTHTAVERNWTSRAGRLEVAFRILEPKTTAWRFFYVLEQTGVDAFITGSAVVIDVVPRHDTTPHRRSSDVTAVTIFPVSKTPRWEVFDALTANLRLDPIDWLELWGRGA